MAFSSLDWPLSIKTTTGDPVGEFFVPALAEAHTYDVAVGYFSSAWVRDAAEGLARFATNGGKARWILSPALSEEDFLVISDDSGASFDVQRVNEIVARSFQDLFEALKREPRVALGWLLADKVIQIRVGIPQNRLTGIMHAKMGLFSDHEGNKLGFSGSYNLTHGAQTNWEKIEIFQAWASDESRRRVEDIREDFEAMWRSEDPNLAVYCASDEALQPFVKEARRTTRPYPAPEGIRDSVEIPPWFLTNGKLRDYQEQAISKWFQKNGRGILNMATGSGKTATALAAAVRLAQHSEKSGAKLTIVIVVPYRHLADQWDTEAREFGFEPIVCYDSAAKWTPKAETATRRLATGEIKTVVYIVVNATFARPPFQFVLEHCPAPVCLIADEVHNLGAPNLVMALPSSCKFRMGLSATPVRHGDEQGTKAIEAYFGPEIINFGLKDAIENGYLAPYRYFPILVKLTDDEMAEYTNLSHEIAKAYVMNASDDDGPSDRLKLLLIKRARLVAGAENKLVELQKAVSEHKDSNYNLVYCGDVNDGDERHVEKAQRILGTVVGMRTRRFTAAESPAERREILGQFGRGELQALIAIRCLDEGVDVPRTETAYILASSTNPRQFIQRRGRVLRKAPGKTSATIYDFVAIPDLDAIPAFGQDGFNIERRMVQRELERVSEFASLALNSGETLARLREIKQSLNLMDS